MVKDVVGERCWENGIGCTHLDEDTRCFECIGYEPYRTSDKPRGSSYFEMWVGSQVALYQMRNGGRLHPRTVIESYERLLKHWRWCYGENGFEKEPKWCDSCGWYCECGK